MEFGQAYSTIQDGDLHPKFLATLECRTLVYLIVKTVKTDASPNTQEQKYVNSSYVLQNAVTFH